MATIQTDFEWAVGHGYECGIDDKAEQVIRQTNPGRDFRRPLEINPRLYLAFAELDGSPDACLKFAKSWGLLRQPAKLGAFERLDDWQREIEKMIGFVNAARMVELGGIRMRIMIELVSGEQGGKPVMIMHPPKR
jgi:hypothetical protein